MKSLPPPVHVSQMSEVDKRRYFRMVSLGTMIFILGALATAISLIALAQGPVPIPPPSFILAIAPVLVSSLVRNVLMMLAKRPRSDRRK